MVKPNKIQKKGGKRKPLGYSEEREEKPKVVTKNHERKDDDKNPIQRFN